MKKSKIFLVLIALCVFGACRKKQKDIEVQFVLNGTAEYCGASVFPDGTEFCPSEIKIVSTGARYVYNHPLDTSITNKHNWWNKTYIATIEKQKSVCECTDGMNDPQPGYEPTLQKKPIVKIKKIKLKE